MHADTGLQTVSVFWVTAYKKWCRHQTVNGNRFMDIQGAAPGKGNIVTSSCWKFLLIWLLMMSWFTVITLTYDRVQTAFHILSIFHKWFQHLNTSGPQLLQLLMIINAKFKHFLWQVPDRSAKQIVCGPNGWEYDFKVFSDGSKFDSAWSAVDFLWLHVNTDDYMC